MSVLYAVLLGIIQGITEFLPVSSFGHLSIVQNMLGVERNAGLLFEAMLHLGTLAAIVLTFRKELKRILLELLGMFMDIIGNINLYIHNKKTGDGLRYAKIVHGTYRKLAALLVVSSVPTAILGYTARRLVIRASISPLIPGIGLLLTGILLLVIDFSKSGGEKSPREARYDSAMWVGICQGLSVFPGLSRSGLTISAALLCGYSRKFAVKFSYIVSVPAVIGAFFSQAGEFTAPTMSVGLGFTYVLGMIVAGAAGCFTIRFLLKLVQTIKFRYFAYYCFLAGILGLGWNFM